MKYDMTKWFSNVSSIQHSLASEARIMLADAHDDKGLEDAEIATIKQWIRDSERIRDEAYALLAHWTDLPNSNKGDA